MRVTHLLFLALAVAPATWAGCGTDETERQREGYIEGIDVSHHQPRIDWPQVAADGINFAYVKATEGQSHRDTKFCENWASAKTAGLYRGAYHFYRADVNPREQFEHFRAVVSLVPGDLSPVLDVETLDGADKAELIEGLRTWLYLAEIEYGIKPVIYTNLKFYYHHLAGQFDDYPFWIARYGNNAPSVSSAATVAFWQYGDRGRVDGVTGHVDLNVFLGDSQAFGRLQIPEPTYTTLGPREAGANAGWALR